MVQLQDSYINPKQKIKLNAANWLLCEMFDAEMNNRARLISDNSQRRLDLIYWRVHLTIIIWDTTTSEG